MSLRTGFALVSAAGIPSGIATKQNNTVVWKDIMPNSLYKAYLCKEINLVGWFKTENENRYVPNFIVWHIIVAAARLRAPQKAAWTVCKQKKRRLSSVWAVTVSFPLQECTRSFTCSGGLPGSEIVAPATEVWINTSTQALSNNHQITCNPRYTAGMPIILDLSK